MKITNQSIIKAFAVIVLLLGITTTTNAQSVSQVVDLAPGWNIVSTPMVLQSHAFSAAETSTNFDIYILDASKPTGWATMADLGQTQFAPLFGYFINNKTGDDQKLTFNFESDVPPNQKLFERTFTAEGWYSVGVANAEYAKTQKADRSDANNPSSVLSLLTGNYDLVIDFTDDTYENDRNSVALSDPWKAVVPSDINQLNDLRDTKGYAIYIKQAGARYNGFQNDPAPEIEFPEELVFGLSSNNPDSTTIIVDEDEETNFAILEYRITASNGDVALDELAVNIQTDTAIESVISSVKITIGGKQYSSIASGITTTSADFTFNIDEEVVVPEGESLTAVVSVRINGQLGNYANGETIQAQVNAALVDATVGNGIDGLLDETRLNGSAVGYIHTLAAAGLLVPADGFAQNTDTFGENDQFGEFTLEFDVTALEDDYYITDNSFDVTNSETDGIGFTLQSTGAANITSSVSSTADEDTNGVFTVREGETETFTLTVTVDPDVTGQYRVTLSEIWFSNESNGITGAKKHIPFPIQDFRTNFININSN